MGCDVKVLVTGGAAGIGRAIVERFLGEGAAVSVLDRDVAPLSDLAGPRLLLVDGDVSSEDTARRAVAETVREFGGLDVLVNNAGTEGRPNTVVDETESGWDAVVGVNLKSVFFMSKYAVPELLRAGSGAVVNVVSVLGVLAEGQFAAYCASKAGVLGLTRQMAVDYGRRGIRVNAVCPSAVDTPMLRREAAWGADPAASLEIWGQAPPLGRLAEPSDVAGPVWFLASEDASYITGVTLMIDGGLSASQRIGSPSELAA